MRVKIDRKLLRSFVRRAKRRLPDEYVEALFGRINGNVCTILALEELEHETDDDPDGATILGEREPFEKRGRLMRLGSIHSHPQLNATATIVADCSPSETDWIDQKENAEAVSGICFLFTSKGKTPQIRSRILFYAANALLDTTYV